MVPGPRRPPWRLSLSLSLSSTGEAAGGEWRVLVAGEVGALVSVGVEIQMTRGEKDKRSFRGRLGDGAVKDRGTHASATGFGRSFLTCRLCRGLFYPGSLVGFLSRGDILVFSFLFFE